MRITMTETRLVAVDGITATDLVAGSTYDVPDDLGKCLIGEKWAAEYDPKAAAEAEKVAKDKAATEAKDKAKTKSPSAPAPVPVAAPPADPTPPAAA